MSLELGILLFVFFYGLFMYCWGWWDGKQNKDKLQISFGGSNKQVMN